MACLFSCLALSDDGTLHVHPRPPDHHGFGLMPAVGVVITARGAKHVLQCLPIADNNDGLLSDTRTASGRQSGLWYMRPYTFLPAAALQHECLNSMEGGHCKPRMTAVQAEPLPRPGAQAAMVAFRARWNGTGLGLRGTMEESRG